MPVRYPLVLFLLILLPITARAASSEGQIMRVVIPVDARGHWDLQGDYSVSLTFPIRPLTPKDVAPLSAEDVRAILNAFEGVYGRVPPPSSAQVTCTGASARGERSEGYCHAQQLAPDLERRIREDSARFYSGLKNSGTLDGPLEGNRFFQALKLSTRYMGPGARTAAEELFTSPAFVVSLCASITLYMLALAAPEPFISKGAVAAITFWLMAAYGFSEVVAVGTAVKRLYDESSAAMSTSAQEEAARHFGESIGGVGLRILVTIAIGRLGGKLPEVPTTPGAGGLWTRLGRVSAAVPRVYASSAGASLAVATAGGVVEVSEVASTVTSTAGGNIVLMGATLGTTAEAVRSALKAARVSGDCGPKKTDDNEGHHIGTDKNEVSDANGGPWTPRFKDLFKQAGLTLDDLVNIVFLKGHRGPHPVEYHKEVYDRLKRALGSCATPDECRPRLEEELDRLAADICKPGSRLNKLTTKKQ